MGQDRFSRRKFVTGTTATALGATILPRHVLGGPGWQSPSDRLNIAIVGAGARGASDAAELVTGGEEIVALADVDLDFVESSVARRTKDRDGNPNPSFIIQSSLQGSSLGHPSDCPGRLFKLCLTARRD